MPSQEAMRCLEQMYKNEMAGINRYLHYSFMIMGYHRIPIQAWLRTQAAESMTHSVTIGEKITSYGGHPPLVIGTVEETNDHDINTILKESLIHEEHQLDLCKQLARLAEDDIALEEFARMFVKDETEHIEEVKKMLRERG